MKRLNIFFATIIAILTIYHNNADAQDFIYMMPSKEIVETGEDFFFKAYLIDKQSFALSDRSHTLYLQIRTASDSVVWSEKYPFVSGRANGHIYIGAEWRQGEYFMEGYSKSSFTTDSTQAIRPRRIRVVERVAQMDSISFHAVEKDGDQKNPPNTVLTLCPKADTSSTVFILWWHSKPLTETECRKRSLELFMKTERKSEQSKPFMMAWGCSPSRQN